MRPSTRSPPTPRTSFPSPSPPAAPPSSRSSSSASAPDFSAPSPSRTSGKSSPRSPATRSPASAIPSTASSRPPTPPPSPPAGVKTEITVGAATPLSFLGQDACASAELRVGIGQSGPVAVAGSLDITGQIDFESIKFNHLHLAVAIGASDCYIGAKVAGELDTGVFVIGAEVAVSLGKTSRLDPVAKINPNVADLITKLGLGATDATSPLYGAYVYAYGDFSVLSLIGIPPTCLLDIRLGGGQGNFIFYREGAGALAGMQFTHAIRGRALCLVNVNGSIDGYIAGAYSTANGKNDSFSNLKAAGRLNAVLSGKIGVSPLSYTWKKNFAFDVAIDPAASPKTSWSVNY